MLRLRIGMRVINLSGDGWTVRSNDADVEERKVFRRFRRMPLNIAEGDRRLHHVIDARRDADVDRSTMIGPEIKSEGKKMRSLHPQRAPGKTRVSIQSRRNSM